MPAIFLAWSLGTLAWDTSLGRSEDIRDQALALVAVSFLFWIPLYAIAAAIGGAIAGVCAAVLCNTIASDGQASAEPLAIGRHTEAFTFAVGTVLAALLLGAAFVAGIGPAWFFVIFVPMMVTIACATLKTREDKDPDAAVSTA